MDDKGAGKKVEEALKPSCCMSYGELTTETLLLVPVRKDEVRYHVEPSQHCLTCLHPVPMKRGAWVKAEPRPESTGKGEYFPQPAAAVSISRNQVLLITQASMKATTFSTVMNLAVAALFTTGGQT